MTNIDVKMVKDDIRTVIVISGADNERDKLASRLVSLYLGFTSDNELCDLPQVKGLEPIPATTMPSMDDIDDAPAFTPWSADEVMSDGPYAGLTPHQALVSYDSEALAKLYGYAKELKPGRELECVKKACKLFMRNLPTRLSYYDSSEKKKKLLTDAAELMKIDFIINGYPNITDFCNRATDAEIDAAVRQVARALQDRGDRS